MLPTSVPTKGTFRRNILVGILTASTLTLAACGGGGTTSDTSSAGQNGAAAENQVNTDEANVGGTVTIGLDRQIPSLDPKEGLMGQQPILILSNALYEPIMLPTEGGAVEPVKAETFEANEDATEWTLTLKDGLVFSNGDPLDAQAVIAHVERMQDPAIGASTAGTAAQIVGMEAPDEKTVVFTLEAPNAHFTSLFARQLGMIGHPTEVDAYGHPLGSGPYQVADFDSGNQITLERAENYWAEEGVADQLVYRMLSDANARMQSLQAGDVDLIWTESSPQITEARADDALNVSVAPAATSAMLMNQNSDVLSDPEVRLALVQAIDQNALNQVVNEGEGVPVHGPYALLNGAPDVDYPEYDPEAAAEVLDGRNLSISMLIENRPDTTLRATAVQDMLSQVGVTVEINAVESANFVSELDAGNWDVADFVTSIFSDPTGAQLLFHTEGAYNFMDYSNPTVDEAIESLEAETDAAARTDLYGTVSQTIADDSALAWYTAANAGVLSDSELAGIPDVSEMTLISINPKTIGHTE